MVDGSTVQGLEAVREAFQANLDSELEHGDAVAVWLDGKPVVSARVCSMRCTLRCDR